ncbi:hypothetical protein [uncultured Aquitalea sp.]|uniref:hypothetical protein n=1 Tax=uncultured Aquitalea sp. TaxID=540272 RepID=UPI0025F15A0F|nr:hypothetical protein [uncultured Aquitalea sp.]
MPKIIYHYEPKTGRYICQGVADECNFEPGTYIVPACATFDPVPTVADGQAAFYTPAFWETGIAKEEGGAWRVENIIQQEGQQ